MKVKLASGLEFRSMAEAKEFYKFILDNLQDGETVPPGACHKKILEVLQRHPERDQKIGSGIRRFYKGKTEYKTSCFWIERTDGSRTDFSYITCISGKADTPMEMFTEACRAAVKDDVARFATAEFDAWSSDGATIVCPLSGDRVGRDQCHVDHTPPMTLAAIVDAFLAQYDITNTVEILSLPGDNQTSARFTDKTVEELFRVHHRKLASLRLISAKANLSTVAITHRAISHVK